MLNSLDHSESQLRQNPKFMDTVRKLKPKWDLHTFEKVKEEVYESEEVLTDDQVDLESMQAFFPADH